MKIEGDRGLARRSRVCGTGEDMTKIFNIETAEDSHRNFLVRCSIIDDCIVSFPTVLFTTVHKLKIV